MFAPTIENHGTIETPDGQTLMAAAEDKVYLMVSDNDDDYRGLIVEVSKGGTVTNAELGKIIAERGNVTLLGNAVNQDGRIKATTAVDLNGTVRLLARDGAAFTGADIFQRGFDSVDEAPSSDEFAYAHATRGGTVTLGENSRVEILPDSNGKTAPDLQAQNPSKVEIMGKTVVLEKNSAIVVPAGEVIVTATETPNLAFRSSAEDDPDATLTGARVFMDEGSLIDVSGVEGVELDMSRNVLEVELRGNELKDSPLQRNGVLRGETVKVDLRRGDDIAIADISAAVASIQRDASERMVKGGSIKLNSTGDVVQKQGAALDVSGGSINYSAGMVESTKLIADGIIYDISEADPNRVYDGIVGKNVKLHEKWNLTETFVGMNTQSGGVWVEAYTQGHDAGSIDIDAHRLLLEGSVHAGVIDGIEQRDIADRAAAGALNIALRRGLNDVQEVRFVSDMIYHDIAKDDVIVDVLAEGEDTATEGDTPAAKTVLIDNDGDGIGELLLSDDMLSNSGLGKLSVRSMHDISIEQGADVQLRDGNDVSLYAAAKAKDPDVKPSDYASLSLLGNSIVHSGSITAHGRIVELRTDKNNQAAIGEHFDITLTDTARIDVSGRFTNDYVLGQDAEPVDAITVDAGMALLNARGALTLAEGSVIDADGGAFIAQQGKLRAGKGGDISLRSAVEGGADMTLDGHLSAHALAQGGRLSIEAASVAIGDNPDTASVATGHVLHLDNDFFNNNEGGFSRFNITANLQSLHVDGSANLQLTPRNYVFDPALFLSQPGGTDIDSFAAIDVLPAWAQKPTAISLTLKQSQLAVDNTGSTAVLVPEPVSGRFAIDTGARIATNAGGEITLASDNSLFIDGSLRADGGALTATVTPHSSALRAYDATQSLWLGSNAQLASNAVWVEGEVDPNGLRGGEMFDAGTIRLEAQRGILAIEKRAEGASIEASGASAQYDAVVTASGQSAVREFTAEGAAGTIELLTAEGLFVDGDLKMTRASESAAGGQLLAGFSAVDRKLGVSDPSLLVQFPSNAPVISIGDGRESALDDLQFGDALAQDDPRLGTVALDGSKLNAMDLDVLTLDARNRDYVAQNGDPVTVSGRIEFADAASVQTERELNLLTENLRVADDSLITLQSAVVRAGVDEALLITRPGSLDPVSRGRGALVIRGDLIDLVGDIGVDNVAELSLASRGDIRVRSNPDIENGGFTSNQLVTAGDINLLAQQVYPNTLADYSLVSTAEGGSITVARADGDAVAPLSAAGRLTLQADNIAQGGVLRAPLGEIVLGNQDTSALTLLPGSLTSVSAEGLQIPLGRILGEDLLWNYNGGAQTLIDRSKLPEKTVALNGDAIDLQQGAVVDLSGGGDIYATEFVTGPGGSVDVLDGANAGNTFAIVPTSGTAYAPYDLNENRGTDIAVGRTLLLEHDVVLASGQRVAAGEYTVLPARYALQPGAVLVTPVAVDGAVVPGQQARRLDGAPVVAGKYAFANTTQADANWSAFAFEPGTVALTRSEYVKKTASEFFTGENALFTMPGDAGQLLIDAGSALNLDVTLASTHAETARGARVDIVADNLLLARDVNGVVVDDTVVIDVADISALAADSILLGGTRSRVAADVVGGSDDDEAVVTAIDVGSTSVSLQDGAQLSGREFLLAATDSVSVGANAQITATAPVAANTSEQILIDGDGALLQVSGVQRAQIARDNETGASGNLTLAAGARLQASQSVVLDASRDMNIKGAVIDSQGLTLSANRIVLGDVAATETVSGAVLDTQLLAQLNPRDFILNSRSDISIASDIAVLAENLSLQAGNISANGHTATFTATDLLTLEGNAASATAADSSGALNFAGRFVQLGAAQQDTVAQAQLALDADAVAITANNGLLLSDALSVRAGGDIAVAAPHVTAVDAAQTAIDADGSINIGKSGEDNLLLEDNALLLAVSAIGASLQLIGDAVAIDTQFKLPSAVIGIEAREGDVTLNDAANINVAGITQQFGDKAVASAGGNVELSATLGNIVANAGSVIDVSGATLQQDTDNNPATAPVTVVASGAGVLTVNAASGAAALNGAIAAVADANGEGGSFSVDARTVGDSDALLAQLAAGDFDRAISLRQREGDIAVVAGRTIKAGEIHLVADTGSVTVAGTLDASGAKGGEVSISAGQDAVLQTGASIDAHALAQDGRGGNVSIGAGTVNGRNGQLALHEGASIDVRGGNNAADNHGINSIRQGEVHLRARRNADHSVNVAALAATVQGADRIELEAFDDSITATVIDDTKWTEIKTNIDEFVASITTPFIDGLGSLAREANFHLLPGVEVRSDGDMTVATEVDLAAWRFNIGDKSEPGVLTLRAVGDLNVNASISDGYFNDPDSYFIWMYFSTAKQLTDDHSWYYNLVAGADLSAANIDATRVGHGDYVQAADVIVRTGTGDIRVAAGNDIRFVADTSALYTAGRTSLYRYATPADLIGYSGLDGLGNEVILGDTLEHAYVGAVHPWMLNETLDPITGNDRGVLPERIMFGYEGGDITIAAGNDIDMPETRQMSSDWLQRYYGDVVNTEFPEFVTLHLNTWGVVASDFHQGIAALGGGDIDIAAGGDITNLAASIPVTLRQNLAAAVNNAENPAPVTGEIVASDDTYMWERNGGGDLSVVAGGDILSPQLLADHGDLSLDAGGSIGAVAGRNHAVLSVSDTAVALNARRDIGIDAIYNTTVVPQSTLQFYDADSAITQYETYFSVFFSYADETRVDITSTAGDIVFDNSFDLKLNANTLRYTNSGLNIINSTTNDSSTLLRVMPAALTATAQSGDIMLDGNMVLFPSSQGQLELLAKNDISTSSADGQVFVSLSDAATSGDRALPSLMTPTTQPGVIYANYFDYAGNLNSEQSLYADKHARTPVHTGDLTAALLIAADGDIDGKSNLKIVSAKKLRTYAGDDIREISINVQHANSSDTSELRAGGDIDQGFSLTEVGTLNVNSQGIQIAGPGRLDVIAGGDLNLGSSQGIVSIGNQQNAALAEDGADIMAIAGAGSLDTAGVVADYLPYTAGDRDYTAALVEFVLSDRFAGDALALASQITGEIFETETQLADYFAGQSKEQNNTLARALFAQLDEVDQRALVYDIVYEEVRKGGIESLKGLVTDPQTQGFQRGYNAIEALFPGIDQNAAELANATADIGLVFSTISTRDGGDVNFMTPRGGIDVGLAGAFAGLSKGPGELGLLAQGAGDIRGITYGDININASRIFALDGGNILLWSSQNDIDAGKGAKTALAIPSPRVKYNADGEPVGIELPASVSGSGIQAAVYTATREPGSVYLFAPQGVIDAGDAGISSAGDLFLAATEVLGADNINFGGVSIGVPTSTAISASLTSVGDNAATSTASATDDVSEKSSGDCTDEEDCEENNAVAFVTVEIIGLGD